MPANHIPLIDFRASDAAVLAELDYALSSVGFVMIKGHGIAPALLKRMRQVTVDYFKRAHAIKLKDVITADNYRGYIPLGFFSPSTAGSSPDNYEGYKLHLEIAEDDPIRRACSLYGPNRWPMNFAVMSTVVLAYWRACDRLGQRLLSALATIMGVDAAWFLSLFNKPLTNMTLLHYPPQESKNRGFGIHPHKDTDALTLLAPDSVGGLQVRRRDEKEWLEVQAEDDALVVNVGDLLELWSGGYFVSTPHRVLNYSGAERYSFPYFMVPRFDVLVEPLIPVQPGFSRQPVPVGEVSAEVWRTNWLAAQPAGNDFDLGTLPH